MDVNTRVIVILTPTTTPPAHSIINVVAGPS